MTGLQARVKLKNDNSVEFYPFIGSYAWVVPENKDIVRMGVASYNNVKEYFGGFLKSKNINGKKIIDKQGGIIPIYNNGRVQKKNVFLVGDAAGQVKATTGGGIVPGLIGAKCLAKAIINDRDYTSLLKKRLSKELWLHLKARNIMDKFKKKDWNKLIGIFSKESNKKVIERFDRDNLSSFIGKIMIKEPKLWYFVKYLI
jgi:flavin-dependent dehydrogenase